MLFIIQTTMAEEKKNDRYRNFVFTLNNYTDEDEERVFKLPYKYVVYGREVGESETPHLQGYCELNKIVRFKALTELLPRAHLEKRRGTAAQAANYCKKDGDFVEDGEISRQGQRADIDGLVDALKEGKSHDDILENHRMAAAKFPRFYNETRLHYMRKNKAFQRVKVYIRWGPAGALKSAYARKMDPDLWELDAGGKGQWFDGYVGQKTVLIEEMEGQISYTSLLRLLDGYPFDLPIKGGFTWKQWSTVYITSNVDPSLWYPSRGLTPALARRITSITEVTPKTPEEIKEFLGDQFIPENPEEMDGGAPCEILSEANVDHEVVN